MIGVIADVSEAASVEEFFQLFKTPWERYRTGKRYPVLLSAGSIEVPEGAADLVLAYGGRPLPIDAGEAVNTGPRNESGRMLRYKENRFPIYGDCVSFHHGSDLLVDADSGRSAISPHFYPVRQIVRIGYDLFAEVRAILTTGQPAANAATPVLDLHIALLRDLILSHEITLVEIPPIPAGHRFIACLTHDVDHPLVRKHWLDSTMFGLVYRGVFGSLVRGIRGRLSARALVANWVAVLKLPLVYVGLARDFWSEFGRYRQLESGSSSTFFVIPFRNDAGSRGPRPAPAARAAAYGARDISEQLRKLAAEGCEIGLHGIDAWHDSSRADAERKEIQRITGDNEIGVRMHWLYYDAQSPISLEDAGLNYDSTVGYNETIGYRAGTTQVYKPLQAVRLLELPLHVMDTALFYPCYLDLSDEDAWKRVCMIIRNVVGLGGCITVNWHDRSIAPERQWGRFYAKLIEELCVRGGWFATAAQAVSWFRMRRSAVFENVTWDSKRVRARIRVGDCRSVPGLQLRVNRPGGPPVDIPIMIETTDRRCADDLGSGTVDADLAPA